MDDVILMAEQKLCEGQRELATARAMLRQVDPAIYRRLGEVVNEVARIKMELADVIAA